MKSSIRFYLLLLACFAGLLSISKPVHGQTVSFLGSPVAFGDVDLCSAGQPIASCSKMLTLSYEVIAGGTLEKPRVLTGGMPYLDFAFSRSTCAGTVTTGSRCTVVVTFTPRAAGSLSGAVEILNGSGNVLLTTQIFGTGVDASSYFTLTIAPQSLTLSPGSTQTIQVTENVYGGFSQKVAVAMHTLPAGVSSLPGSITLAPGVPQSIRLVAGNTVAPATDNVVFTGTSGAFAHSATLKLTVAPAGASVTTQHNDNARDGVNASETVLTPQTVNATAFGKLRELPTDGTVHAQPLYVSSLPIAGQTHNVLITATEHGTVYAFDADTGTELWHTPTPGTNETASDSPNCYQIWPEIGITSTPVIDRRYGANGAVFLVAMTKDNQGAYHQRLHALDLTTGGELAGGPTEIEASFPGNGYGSSHGMQVFDPAQYEERAGLLLLNGEIYMAWASHCDRDPYTGWLMAYSESTLQQTGVLNLTPNGPSSPHFANGEGGIWMGGTGLSADAEGNVYFLEGNGTFDATFDGNGFPANGDFANSFLKISVNGNKLAVADYFVHYNVQAENPGDEDLGSGGALILPDLQDASGAVRQLAVGAGKDRTIFVVDRTGMGKFGPGSDSSIYQEVSNVLGGGVFSVPAYFHGTLYYAAGNDHLKSIPVQQARLATAASAESTATFKFPGGTPSVSANGLQDGIVWVTENETPTGILHAYDATNVASELYNSSQAAGNRDNFTYSKFVTPTVANGKVFVGTTNSVAVFGLLP